MVRAGTCFLSAILTPYNLAICLILLLGDFLEDISAPRHTLTQRELFPELNIPDTSSSQVEHGVVRPRQTWTSFEGITDALPRTLHPHCASFHSLCPLTHSHTFNSGLWCSLRTVSLSSGSEVNLQITWGKTRSLSFSTQLLGTSLYTKVTNMVRHGVCLLKFTVHLGII